MPASRASTLKITHHDEDPAALVFEEIEPFFLEMFRELPADSDPGDHPAARARLFSEPMSEAEDGDEFIDDWKSFVEPGIRELFLSARDIVVEDLQVVAAPSAPSARKGSPAIGSFDPAAFVPTERTLRVPKAHLEAWLRILNQARLVIAARHGFDERAMQRERPFPPFATPQERDMFKVNFYDDLQQLFMQALGYR
jgi:hypothetical protein